MPDHFSTAARVALIAWARANLHRATSDDLRGIVSDLGGDVEAITSEATGAEAAERERHPHSEDAGRPLQACGLGWTPADRDERHREAKGDRG